MAKQLKMKKNDTYDDEEIEQEPEDIDDENEKVVSLEEIDDIVPQELEEIPQEDLLNIEDIVTNDESDETGTLVQESELEEKEDLPDDILLTTTAHVRICPNCNEEVIDLPRCPVCGFPLEPGTSAQTDQEMDMDPFVDDYEDDNMEYLSKLTTIEDPRIDDPYGDLPYQDKYQ